MVRAEEIRKLMAGKLKLIFFGKIYNPDMVGLVPMEAPAVGNKYLFLS